MFIINYDTVPRRNTPPLSEAPLSFTIPEPSKTQKGFQNSIRPNGITQTRKHVESLISIHAIDSKPTCNANLTPIQVSRPILYLHTRAR